MPLAMITSAHLVTEFHTRWHSADQGTCQTHHPHNSLGEPLALPRSTLSSAVLRTWGAASVKQSWGGGVHQTKTCYSFFCTKNRHGVNGEKEKKRHLLKMNKDGCSVVSCKNVDPHLYMFVIEQAVNEDSAL